jgi:hypothetical protein
MEAPDKIYVDKQEGKIITLNRVYSSDICYIRKDALLEWAKEEQTKCSSETHPYAMFMNVVIDKLNSM